jgi:hypothetical protein
VAIAVVISMNFLWYDTPQATYNRVLSTMWTTADGVYTAVSLYSAATFC